MEQKILTAKTLIDAFPFIKQFTNKIVVIKFGGAAQVDPKLKEKFAKDVALLHHVGIKPVIVHGGGKKINQMLDRLNIQSKFKDGQRVTTKESMEVVEMVLSGSINKNITSLINSFGSLAIGINGKDASFMRAKPKDLENFGLTGVITSINEKVLLNLIAENFIPVIAPIAISEDNSNQSYNINADLAASKIAIALKAQKVIFLTDTKGVLDKNSNLYSTLYKDEIELLIKDNTIKGGMLPKVEACLEAIDQQVEKAHIIDGRIEHSILLELFTNEGIGTVIKRRNI